MCTARPGWQTISFREGAYKKTCHKVAINLVDVLQIDTEKKVHEYQSGLGFCVNDKADVEGPAIAGSARFTGLKKEDMEEGPAVAGLARFTGLKKEDM
ncbi:Delta(24)-sterol reductase [Portunus trituberculatus]|uniref:Delta(24)-sterol reductase n=1 Tax=Portunus trituberculatus TaxID=210409 RepID=A0A5B7IJU4_PORTR|nr:Delta(24)-sterol reductase [Portunus trituberculatus]